MFLLFAIVLLKPKTIPNFPTEKVSSTSKAARWIGIMTQAGRVSLTKLQTVISQRTIVFLEKW